MFNGTQPSNEGCTNGVSIDGQVTIDCGQGATLIDCDRGYNDSIDYSELSNYSIWNRTASRAEQVSIDFKFYQQINISRISLFFWNSPSNSILVPNVMIYWAAHHLRGFHKITNVAINSPNRTEDGQSVVNIDINDDMLKYFYLRIVMTFSSNSEWIFLSEVQFCGE